MSLCPSSNQTADLSGETQGKLHTMTVQSRCGLTAHEHCFSLLLGLLKEFSNSPTQPRWSKHSSYFQRFQYKISPNSSACAIQVQYFNYNAELPVDSCQIWKLTRSCATPCGRVRCKSMSSIRSNEKKNLFILQSRIRVIA